MGIAYRHLESRTLLVPVSFDRFALTGSIHVAGMRLVRKIELHVTVIGSDLGRKLDESIAENPAIASAFDELIAAADFDWTLSSPPSIWHLHADVPRALDTVIVLVDMPGVADFFAACAARLTRLAPELVPWLPPPTHVTLYTSDPHGKHAIGISQPDELARARDRAAAIGQHAGLHAWPLELDIT
ncbi:MAG TPA: hypothetical protein VG755_13165 [Nannocystaceae bacterium]|nr:hypothetical protein [Nannocystaceae bacterium]